jgi:hypothetical protein
MEKLLKRALDECASLDDRLGKSCGSGLSNEAAAQAIIAIATAHIMSARTLLELAMTSRGAAQVFYQHADELATKAAKPDKAK